VRDTSEQRGSPSGPKDRPIGGAAWRDGTCFVVGFLAGFAMLSLQVFSHGQPCSQALSSRRRGATDDMVGRVAGAATRAFMERPAPRRPKTVVERGGTESRAWIQETPGSGPGMLLGPQSFGALDGQRRAGSPFPAHKSDLMSWYRRRELRLIAKPVRPHDAWRRVGEAASARSIGFHPFPYVSAGSIYGTERRAKARF
jgi:hypothetical protein